MGQRITPNDDGINRDELTSRRIPDSVQKIIDVKENGELPTSDQLSRLHDALGIQDNLTDPNALMEGDYKVSRTGNRISDSKPKVEAKKPELKSHIVHEQPKDTSLEDTQRKNSEAVDSIRKAVKEEMNSREDESLNQDVQMYRPESHVINDIKKEVASAPQPQINEDEIKSAEENVKHSSAKTLIEAKETNDEDEVEFIKNLQRGYNENLTPDDINPSVKSTSKINEDEYPEDPRLEDGTDDSTHLESAMDIQPEKNVEIKGSLGNSTSIQTSTMHVDDIPEPVSKAKFSLDDVDFDLDNMSIEEDGDYTEEIEVSNNFFADTEVTSDTQLLQSGYGAEFTSMNLDDIASYISHVGDAINYRAMNAAYSMYYNHLKRTTFSNNISYTDFLSMTSTVDEESIQYGLLKATYPEELYFDFNCQYCGETNSRVPVLAKDMQIIDDEESIIQRENIVSHARTLDEVKANSELGKVTRIKLNNLIVDLKTPSMRSQLEFSASFKEDAKVDTESVAFNLVSYISAFYVPDMKKYKATGELKFIKRDSLQSIFDILRKLNMDDYKKIVTETSNTALKYSVDYGIPEATCEHCGKVNTKVSINVSELLFQKTLGSLQM